MKLFIQFIILLPSVCYALICESQSPLVKKYYQQQDWQKEEVVDSHSGQKIQGFLDKENNLYLADLSRDIKVKTQLIVNKNNTGYDRFFRFCQKNLAKRKLLATYREGNQGHKYHLKTQFLPELSGYANDPYLQMSIQDLEFEIAYTASSIVGDLYNSQEVKGDIYRNLYQQLQGQSKTGQIQLDLTNLDDFACDLIRGDANIRVYQRWSGMSPLIVREEKVSESTVMNFYETLANELPTRQNSAERLFDSGRIFERLRTEKPGFHADRKMALKMLRGFMGTDYSTFNNYGITDLKCLSSNLQEYYQEPIYHLLNIRLKLNQNLHLYPEN